MDLNRGLDDVNVGDPLRFEHYLDRDREQFQVSFSRFDQPEWRDGLIPDLAESPA